MDAYSNVRELGQGTGVKFVDPNKVDKGNATEGLYVSKF